ncbi:TonB-dependent receptor [Rhodovulum viride]|uniref:TonB-dependent receptor n=1 Tax=Rhodovulum viride TaxID=1231134 RepID=A0ABX9DK67_9RHOB|nr:TonB-dependent receptor [Rhodovulum viride]RAP42538.1 TonB-dependent receptor [Rhodovulum viride]
MNRTSRGLLLLGACWAGSAAFGQDTNQTYLGTLRIEGAEAQDLLGNTEVTTEDLENRNPSSVKDVFQGEASVTVGGGAAIAQKVFVNGIEESLLSVTIDGARQNKGAFHHTGNVLIDPELLKRVEVTKGLAPADAGPGGLAGSIAYETKDARDLLEPGKSFGGIASIGTSTNGTDLRSALTVFGQQGGLDYLLSGTREIGGEYEDGDGTTMRGTEPDLSSYTAKLGFTTPSGKRLTFSASETEDEGRRAAQLGGNGLYFIRPDFAGLTSGDSVLVDGYARRSSFTLGYTDEAPEGWFAPKLQLSYNEQEVDVVGAWGLNTSLSGSASNEWQIGTGTLTAGLDFFDETAKGRGRGTAPYDSRGKESMTNVGLFAQARQDLTDRVSVSYGLRYDTQEFDAADGQEFDGSGLSANASVDVVLTERLTLNAGIASTWGGYELGEAALVNFGGDWTYDGFTTSRSTASRLGLRYETGPWSVSGAVFYTGIDDLNAVLPTGADRGALADVTSRGVEGSIGWQGSDGFARLNYTYADVKLDGDTVGTTSYYYGRPVGHIIALEGGLDLTPAWRLGGSAEIALKNTDTPTDLSGYEVLNLHATYAPARLNGVEIRFDVRNLLDETYASRSSDGLNYSRVVALNEPGRTFGVSARWRF